MPEADRSKDTKDLLSKDQAINHLLASIAMEELGLSHIIQSEGQNFSTCLEPFRVDRSFRQRFKM